MTSATRDILSAQGLYSPVLAALQAWKNQKGAPETLLEHLYLVQDQRANMHEEEPTAMRLATNHVLHEHILELGHHNDLLEQVLTLRFIEGDSVHMVAMKLHMSPDTVKRLQRKAVQELSSLLAKKERANRQERLFAAEENLKFRSYQKLFGLEPLIRQFEATLLAAEPPWIVSIVGIGGIGKTSLADAICRRLIQHFFFERVVWIYVNGSRKGENRPGQLSQSAMMDALAHELLPQMPPQTLPKERDFRVRKTLKSRPYLVVIDNLESEQESAAWASFLHDLASPSKFLLTSRTRITSPGGIYEHRLSQLSYEAAAELVRSHAQAIGEVELSAASAEQIEAIYAAVGGNPLAIKLVVSLCLVRPLSQILLDLVELQSAKIEQLYTHIYWQAWNSLSPDARVLLEVMPLASHSGLPAGKMQRLSGLDKAKVWTAIDELAHRSLLEVTGTVDDKRYTIHQLTARFLQTEIIRWPVEK